MLTHVFLLASYLVASSERLQGVGTHGICQFRHRNVAPYSWHGASPRCQIPNVIGEEHMRNSSFWGRLIPIAVLFALSANSVSASTTLPLPTGSEVALAQGQGTPHLCSAKPAVDLEAIRISRRVSGQDDLIIHSWFACLTQQSAAVSSTQTTSSGGVATSSALTSLMGQQAQAAADSLGLPRASKSLCIQQQLTKLRRVLLLPLRQQPHSPAILSATCSRVLVRL
jgi:hypothetical protein